MDPPLHNLTTTGVENKSFLKIFSIILVLDKIDCDINTITIQLLETKLDVLNLGIKIK